MDVQDASLFRVSLRRLIIVVSVVTIIPGVIVAGDYYFRNREVQLVLSKIQTAESIVVEWLDKPIRFDQGAVRLGGAEKEKFLELLRPRLRLENAPNEPRGRLCVTVYILNNQGEGDIVRNHLKQSLYTKTPEGIFPVVSSIFRKGHAELSKKELKELLDTHIPHP